MVFYESFHSYMMSSAFYFLGICSVEQLFSCCSLLSLHLCWCGREIVKDNKSCCCAYLSILLPYEVLIYLLKYRPSSPTVFTYDPNFFGVLQLRSKYKNKGSLEIV